MSQLLELGAEWSPERAISSLLARLLVGQALAEVRARRVEGGAEQTAVEFNHAQLR